MSTGSKIINILAGEEFSESFGLPWEKNLGIAYIATQDEVTSGAKLELYMQSKMDSQVWLPFYNLTTEENASVSLVRNKIIPCSPYVDGRGAKAVKFKISAVQANDIALEVGLVNF